MTDGYWYHGNGKIGGEFHPTKLSDEEVNEIKMVIKAWEDCGYSVAVSRHLIIAMQDILNKCFAKPKHGRWIIESDATVMHCDVCGWAFEYYGGLEEEWNYCPHCGALMGEVEE